MFIKVYFLVINIFIKSKYYMATHGKLSLFKTDITMIVSEWFYIQLWNELKYDSLKLYHYYADVA